MRVLLIVVIAFLAMAAAAWAKTSSASAVRCVAPAVKFNSATKQFSAKGGRCNSGRKALSVRFSYQYTQRDQLSHSCGKIVLRRGRTFVLKAVPYQTQVRFGVTARGTKRVVWGKWRIFQLHGIDLQCGDLASTPLAPKQALCAWDDHELFSRLGLAGGCGANIPNACAWATPASFVDGVVTAGAIACPQAPCQYLYVKHRPVVWFNQTPISIPWGLRCPGDTGTSVGLFDIRLGHYSGGQLMVDCEARPDALAATSFGIPTEWGGVLMVDFALDPLSLPTHGRYESQTSIFRLSGTQNGCPDLKLAPINGG